MSTVMGLLAGTLSIKYGRSNVVMAAAISSFIGVIFTRSLRLDFLVINAAVIVLRIFYIASPVIIFIYMAYVYKEELSFTIKAFESSLFIVISIDFFVKTGFSAKLLGPLNYNSNGAYSSKIGGDVLLYIIIFLALVITAVQKIQRNEKYIRLRRWLGRKYDYLVKQFCKKCGKQLRCLKKLLGDNNTPSTRNGNSSNKR
jgi:hypothetical protein